MEASRVRGIADEIVSATAWMPSASVIRALMDEYVSQKSQRRRMVILADVYSCLVQDFGGRRDSGATPSGRLSPSLSVRWRQCIVRWPGPVHPDQLSHQDVVCSFCELVHEFYPRARAGSTEQTLIEEHLATEHGVRPSHKRIAR